MRNHDTFDDYTPSELGRIFQWMCDENHYGAPGPVQVRLLLGLLWLHQRRDEHFGNGRLVRNVFEKAIRRLDNRVADAASLTRELLTTFEPDDIVVPDCTPDHWASLLGRPWQFRVTCAGCGKESAVPAEYLGRRAACNQCGHKFRPNWGGACVKDDADGDEGAPPQG